MIAFQCGNCHLTREIPAETSLKRLNEDADKFYKTHRTRVSGASCKKEHILIRIFGVATARL